MKKMNSINRYWPAGPCHDEPDKAHWVDEKTGLQCLIVRNILGALCGYVGVPPGHTLYGEEKGPEIEALDVHGGITYVGESSGDIWSPLADGDTWWIGFHCAHGRDGIPEIMEEMDKRGLSAPYRDIEYVRGEVTRLARQVKGQKVRRALFGWLDRPI